MNKEDLNADVNDTKDSQSLLHSDEEKEAKSNGPRERKQMDEEEPPTVTILSTKGEKARASNLTWVVYALVLNISFLCVVPSWKIILTDVLTALAPLLMNLAYVYLTPELRQKVLPEGICSIIFYVYLGLLIFGFGGVFVVAIAGMCITKKEDWVSMNPNVVMESFICLASFVTAIQLGFFLSYVMECKRQDRSEK